ncbi:MAG: peroxiredoxin family protein [Planctomycetaceae bacterium]
MREAAMLLLLAAPIFGEGGGGDGPVTEWAKLKMEYAAASQRFWEAFEAAPSDDARAAMRHPSAEFLPRFRDFARRHKGHEVTIEAYVEILMGQLMGQHEEKAARDEARAALLADHVTSPALVPALWVLTDDEQALRTILEKSPHRTVLGPAQLLLGILLKESERPGALAALRKAQSEYADLPLWLGRTVGEKAAGEIFELERLQVGLTAPEIEGTDQDGAPLRLSEYRGKVVFLDFWGDW